MGGTAQFKAGELAMKGWTQLGSRGLWMQEERGMCLIGDIIGWGLDFAKWHTERDFGARWSLDNRSFEIDLDAFHHYRVERKTASLIAPGQEIYGHWLLDYVPRIFCHRKMDDGSRDLRIEDDRSWMKSISSMCRLKERAVGFADGFSRVTFEDATLPSFLKRGYAIHEQICREAWLQLRLESQRGQSKKGERHERIFVTRTKFGGARPIANAIELDELATSFGYRVLSPERMSVEEQAEVFRHAKLIVGQDGSALHNAVFADHLVALGVFSLPDRRNFWHASICNALRAKIAFVEADNIGVDWSISVEKAAEMFSALENCMLADS